MKHCKKICAILSLLEKAYGRVGPLRRTDPIDELVRTILSQNTQDKNSLGAFSILKNGFRNWECLLKADTGHIAGMIKHAGLANIKAVRIKGVLGEIKRREGSISLSLLKKISVKEGLDYLKSLKGIGPKTAACVLLFSFAKPVMPVDTHIFRVTKRLGLIAEDTDIDEAHEMLSGPPDRRGNVSRAGMVPQGLIYKFHLCIIEHGRRTCAAQRPRCRACVLYRLCKFEKKTFYMKRGA